MSDYLVEQILQNTTLESILQGLGKAGLTNEEIARVLSLSPDQFARLLSERADLYDVLMEAKEEPNHQVEKALFKRALGYETREVTAENGKPKKVVVREVPPDPVSCIFWLKNRDPKKWRDVVEMKFSLRDRLDRAHEAITAPRKKIALKKTED